MVDHGDPAIRDSDIQFSVFPGRDGRSYSAYRLPHSLAGVPAILLADAMGTPSELRREFFFSLVGAVLGGVLAVFYLGWFRSLSCGPVQAVAWALGGVFCTPNWYYATSSFDDFLGSLFLVAAIVFAWLGRRTNLLMGASLSGLALGAAFNAKQPLGIFVLPALAMVFSAPKPLRIRIWAAALVLGGLTLGLAVYKGYEWYKFPPGTTGEHERILATYLPAWPGDTLAGLCGFLFSPGAGVFWYCPPLFLMLAGLLRWRRGEPVFVAAVAVSSGAFVLFCSTMSIFKGDVSWGPRYITPVFAMLWMFAGAGAAVAPPRRVRCLLGLGLIVQLLALSVDPYRLYVYHRASSSFYAQDEWVYFRPPASHLLNRPSEILEILRDDGTSTTTFSPAPRATHAPAAFERMDLGPDAVRKYRFLASLRPWWISQRWLSPSDRPVPLLSTAGLFAGAALVGLGLLCVGIAPPYAAPKNHKRL